MLYFNVFIQELAAIFLFFYSIERFSHLILNEHLEKIKLFFEKVADNNTKAFITGCFGTVILQSSTAVSSLAVTLVNAGVLRISSAMPMIFGSSVGTSSTALLVSLKLKSMEEILIIIGVLLQYKKKHAGRAIFYLGLLLFSIEQMTIATSVLKDSPPFQYLFTNVNNHFGLFFIGIFLTVILQSSSLMTSMLVVLIGHNGVSIQNAMIIGIGSFVGTTLTALIVSLRMHRDAKIVASLNCIISLVAGFLNLFMYGFFIIISELFKDPGFGFAVGNTIARLFSSGICMMFLISYEKWIFRFINFDTITRRFNK